MSRVATWLYTSAVAAGETVRSPWFRTASASDIANDAAVTRRGERYDKQFFRGYILNAVGSAAGGLLFQFSDDGTNVSWSDTAQTVVGSATVPFTFSIPMFQGAWVRLAYTHGAIPVGAALWVARAWCEVDV